MATTIPQTALATVEHAETLQVASEERAFALVQRKAKALAEASLVPKEFQNNIPNCIIALEFASRLKCSPFMVMQSLSVIQGRPSLSAQFLIATVNSSGRFTPLRFRFTGERGKDTWGCIAVAQDRATGEVCEGAEVTIAIAKGEGWSSRNGSKWKTMPQQMLQYRAAAFWVRVYCPELSMGMQSAEELTDIGPAQSFANGGKMQRAGREIEAEIVGGEGNRNNGTQEVERVREINPQDFCVSDGDRVPGMVETSREVDGGKPAEDGFGSDSGNSVE